MSENAMGLRGIECEGDLTASKTLLNEGKSKEFFFEHPGRYKYAKKQGNWRTESGSLGQRIVKNAVGLRGSKAKGFDGRVNAIEWGEMQGFHSK